ncbi:ABC transporter permease [Desulfitobacterium sp. Sab5]|uniref:ABC transporter permease n=1 Tax=Desulfitobacterium nosdiversum TaxID=3375356 RepID=UPI003CE83F56
MLNLEEKEKNILDRGIDILLFIGVPLGLIALWEILSNKGVINPSILPAPSEILKIVNEMLSSGELVQHLQVSILRVVKGFVIGSTLGIVVGTLMGFFPKFNRSMMVIVGVLRPIPIIGWIPLLILWMGIDEGSKVTVIAIGSFWELLLNTIHGINTVDKKYLEVATILEKSKITTLIKVVFPSALPSILTGIRLGVAGAWKSVVAAELIAATSGIGYLISYAREISQPGVMLVGLLTIGLIGLLIDFVILRVQSKIIR